MYLRSYKCGARDGHAGKRDRASKLTRREMEMQVIASKDAEIEDLKKRLKDATDIIKSRDDTISARDAQIAGLQSELEDLKKRLAELNETHSYLKVEHQKCLDLIPALRRQIKETKDALELDTPKLLDIKDKVQAETADRQKQLEARVVAKQITEAKGGRVKLGAGAPPKRGALPVLAASGGKNGLEFGAMDLDANGALSKAEFQSKLRIMGWSLEEAEQTFKAMDRDGDGGISADEYAAFCQMEDKNLEYGTLDGIAKLRRQLADLQAQLADMIAKLPPPLPTRICGVGMLLEAHEGQEELSVTKLVPGSPAQLCGLIQKHDLLYKVQETEVSGWDLDEVCNLIKGVAIYIWCCMSAYIYIYHSKHHTVRAPVHKWLSVACYGDGDQV
jgi:hypothetical protein